MSKIISTTGEEMDASKLLLLGGGDYQHTFSTVDGRMIHSFSFGNAAPARVVDEMLKDEIFRLWREGWTTVMVVGFRGDDWIVENWIIQSLDYFIQSNFQIPIQGLR